LQLNPHFFGGAQPEMKNAMVPQMPFLREPILTGTTTAPGCLLQTHPLPQTTAVSVSKAAPVPETQAAPPQTISSTSEATLRTSKKMMPPVNDFPSNDGRRIPHAQNRFFDSVKFRGDGFRCVSIYRKFVSSWHGFCSKNVQPCFRTLPTESGAIPLD
jgi:hypothetical protein